MDGKSVSIQVSGRVQNVGYRYHAKEAANRFGVRGFVKNQPDGTVYAEVVGSNLAVELFCEWFRKGPDWDQAENLGSSFSGINI
jgi:acylphosphatase